ncbi:hypothetical protein K458DRAFT_431974 [Lentithecium fluviatile CBS 122367]|uniref:FAD/NAD(P)-binding domain-containing protein n=1 Tax=Lentithecium fluviatile CBS 122367 TaxID=1168545 RepID=A0A6G1IZS0_9PLEO|nr:hypothetical protein K458DRAFT_431974 [Lentithecium fluviatile CBS 122367]
MAAKLPRCVDTVIIGNGPSALILSYILHGHIPYYIGGHHDPILDQKLSKDPSLLHLTPDLYAHFLSSLRYSTAALPVNTLLDTLIRPNADTEINPTSCVEWRHEPNKAVSHVALGDAPHPGGQWAENPVSASADIGTLSYAEQLSLPGYSYEDHLAKGGKADKCDFVRPSRTEVADYLNAYPEAVGIADAIHTGTRVDSVYRTSDGFVVGSLGIRCKHLVLASGIFTVNIPPPPLLAPIAHLDAADKPLLVVGSGFSAADVIISAPLSRKIIHVYQWAPDTRPSPLRGCHQSAYPEYATIYKQMKLAAIASHKVNAAISPLLRRKSNPFFQKRDWACLYKGFPNAEILGVSVSKTTGTASVTIRLASGEESTREVGGLAYVIGRRGSLDYLSPNLRAEVLGTSNETGLDSTLPTLISGRTLRPKSESSLEVAKNVFIIGSLAGDSLIRHAVGGCVFAAGRILKAIPSAYTPSPSFSPSPVSSTPRSTSPTPESEPSSQGSTTVQTQEPASIVANGHEDLHLDRRKMTRAVEVASAENMYWFGSGWWAGGLGPRRADV